MPIQFLETIPSYAQGRRANMEEWNTVSRTLATGSANVGFGVPIQVGTAYHTVTPLTAAAQPVQGITEASLVLPHTGDAYQALDTVGVCESGVIGVLLGANVTKNAQARFDVTNQNWTGATASATVLTIPGATFDEAGTSGAVGIVRYRRPNPSVSASS